jgi:hypothetical protein
VLLALGVASACGSRSELLAPGRSNATSGSPAPTPEEVCAQLEAGLEVVQVDMFFMFDTSGSMGEVTAEGTSKWQALTQAMWSFLFDPAASGLSVGVGFFPRHNTQVAAFCYAGVGCAGADDCVPIGQCMPGGATMCSTDEQCPGDGEYCQLTGYCQGGGLCDPNTSAGCPFGACNSVGYCASHTRCDADAYRITALATLPDDAFGFANAIEAHPLDGFTPTLPAFQGVMQSAREWQDDHSDDAIVAVLATDGLPTLCDPALQQSGIDAGVASLANVAAEGYANGIRSYVLGVFTPQEEATAKPRLDDVAKAGGTGTAFVVSTDENVAGKLVDALNQVRLENTCSFLLPEGIEQLDLKQVRVSATLENGSSVEFPQRAGVASCDPETGGFYFEPQLPQIPKHIVLCPASCALHPTSLNVTCAES